MEIEKIDFLEGIDILADKANIDMDEYSFDSQKYKKKSKDKKEYKSINQYALNFFQKHLQKNENAKDYLEKERQLSQDLISKFQLGYAPDSHYSLIQHLNKKGADYDKIKNIGLGRDNKGDMYSFFRDRVMFPIMDHMDNVVGFAGRALSDDDDPKYLNVPETPLYDKSKVLYGLNFAKKNIRDHDKIIIVEGYMDVIALHQGGLPVGVASCGTSLTLKHIKLLKRYTDNIILAFDNDDAGLDAIQRSLKLAYQLSVFPQVLNITDPEYKDIDDLITDQDIQNLNLEENDSIELVEGFTFLLDTLVEKIGLDNPTGRKKINTQMFELLSGLDEHTVIMYYIEQLADKIGINYDNLFSQFKSFLKNENKYKRYDDTKKQSGSQKEMQMEEKYLLGSLFFRDFLEQNNLENESIYEIIEFLMVLSQHFPSSLLQSVFEENVDKQEKQKLLQAQLWWEKHFDKIKETKSETIVLNFLKNKIRSMTKVVLNSKKLEGDEKQQLIEKMHEMCR